MMEWPDDATGLTQPVEAHPGYAYGRLAFVRNRVALAWCADMLAAGESPGVVAEEYDLTPDEVADVQRYVGRWLR